MDGPVLAEAIRSYDKEGDLIAARFWYSVMGISIDFLDVFLQPQAVPFLIPRRSAAPALLTPLLPTQP